MAADVVGRISLAHCEQIPEDGWHFYRVVLGTVLDAQPALIEPQTNAQMAALSDVIDMGPFDVLNIIPLISGSGTTGVLDVVGYDPVVPVGQWQQGVEGSGWLGISVSRLSLATPSAAIGDITGLVPLIPATAKAFTAITLTATPTQNPGMGNNSARAISMQSEFGIASVRPQGIRKVRVLVTAISAGTDNMYLMVRRGRIYSGV